MDELHPGVRKLFSIPAADETTLAWWDVQASPSASLNALIRCDVRLHGHTDVVLRKAVGPNGK